MPVSTSIVNDLLAQSQQDAVLKAINESVSRETPPWVIGVLLAIAAAGVAAVVIVNYRNRRKPVESVRKVKRNARKLVKEVSGALNLAPGDLRKLEHHAEKIGVQSPLTLLLCPSLVRKAEEAPREG